MKVNIATTSYPITYHYSWTNWYTHIRSYIKDAKTRGADILLFPEYGAMELTSLLSVDLQQDIHRQIAAIQDMIPDFIKTFQSLAIEHQMIIIAPSIPYLVRDSYVNRTFVFHLNGAYDYQDKWFMTRFENETWNIRSIDKRIALFKTPFGTFGIQTCYDSEFPIGSAILASHKVDMIMVPSCTETITGANRVHIGARSRALENQCYTIVSQTVGDALWSPAVDFNYGWTAVYATPDHEFPSDGIITEGPHNQPSTTFVELDLSILSDVRVNSQVLNYQDHMRISYKIDKTPFIVKVINWT